MDNRAELKNIIKLFSATFSGHPWHGPAVMEALADVSPKTAKSRVSEKTNSIAELVMHMEAWRNFVIHKLKNAEFEMTEELNFPTPGSWPNVISKLKKSQKELIIAIRTFPETKLYDIVPGRKYDFYGMLHGLITHDIYHVGQIMLIKKACQVTKSK